MLEDTRSNSIFGENFFPLEATLITGEIIQTPDVSRLLTQTHEKHPRTAQHMADVALLAAAILVDLNELDSVDESLARATVTAAMVHDVGKLHDSLVPLIDYPGEFSDAQRCAMRMHTQYGAAMVSELALPDRGLVSDIVRLHHSDKNAVEAFIEANGYGGAYAQGLRFGVMIVTVADVFEATMPIGAANSHATYGNRQASFDEVSRQIYEPLTDRLPEVPDTEIVLAIAKMFSRARVAEYAMGQLVAA